LGTRASQLLLLLACGAGCGFGAEQPVPLYDAGNRLGPDEVATLGGYLAHVDGRDVSALGGAFEVLPGCHVVTTPTNWGSMSTTSGVSASTGAVTFAVPMVAGHHYAIISVSEQSGAPTFRVRVRMDETNASGDFVRSFDPVKTSAELDACRQPPPAA
jgi:hypothetical protein